jgi:4-hydroxymandelate oxidase
LPGIIEVVDNKIEVLIDGGIRRGSDILKALALGAKAVGVGRPILWGLAYDGQQGVEKVLEILRSELDLAMALCGRTSSSDIESDLIFNPG